MPLFVKALGFEGCNGCHAEGDFKKKTRNLKIAEHMYDEFVVAMRDGYPINILGRIKDVPEVCNIFCATANPAEAIVAETESGRGILGVVDGDRPKGVETEADTQIRIQFLQKIGYKR